MLDICDLLGTKKLNTTAYHPQCDGMVERFNRTLKTAIRKYTARFGDQWDNYISRIVWAYRHSPHDSTGEKLSFLLLIAALQLCSQTLHCKLRVLMTIESNLFCLCLRRELQPPKPFLKLRTLTKSSMTREEKTNLSSLVTG